MFRDEARLGFNEIIKVEWWVLNLWVATPLGMNSSFTRVVQDHLAYQIYALQYITVTKLQL